MKEVVALLPVHTKPMLLTSNDAATQRESAGSGAMEVYASVEGSYCQKSLK